MIRRSSVSATYLLLSSCTPTAWRKPGHSLETGEPTFEQCQQITEQNTASVDYFDVAVTVNVTSPYDTFAIKSHLEQSAQDAAFRTLQDIRHETVAARSRQWMFDNGWQDMKDPR